MIRDCRWTRGPPYEEDSQAPLWSAGSPSGAQARAMPGRCAANLPPYRRLVCWEVNYDLARPGNYDLATHGNDEQGWGKTCQDRKPNWQDLAYEIKDKVWAWPDTGKTWEPHWQTP